MGKNVFAGLIAILIVVVMASGCTGSTTEKLVGTYSLSEASSSALGGSELIKDLPANTESVRVEYTLTGDGYGSNGNFGVNPDKIDPGSGEDPVALIICMLNQELVKQSKEVKSWKWSNILLQWKLCLWNIQGICLSL